MAIPGQIDLNDIVIFVGVAESGGFNKAALRLGVAAAKVSIEVARLEEKLGISLFARSTRTVSLTDAGQRFFEDCRPVLNSLKEAIENVSSGEKELTGTLRISATVDHASSTLAPALAKFVQIHPKLKIDLRTSDKVINLIEEGIDVAIRIGWLKDSSLRATKLAEFEQYLVATPEYMKKFKKLNHPSELTQLNWIGLSLLASPFNWKFSSKNGERSEIQLKSNFKVDSTSTLRSLIESHLGASVLDEVSVKSGLKQKRLIRILPDWNLPSGGIFAVYPAGGNVQAKVRTFIDFYRQYLVQALK